MSSLNNDKLIIYDSAEEPVIKEVYRDLCEDISAKNVPLDLDEIERQIERLKQRWGEFTYLIGERLKYVLDNKLYEKNKYPNFKSYVNIALKMAENNAYYYIAVYNYFTEEQTRMAGSKLKLIIPFLNKIKNDRTVPESLRDIKIQAMRDDLFYKIYKKSYREAEKTIKDIKSKFYLQISDLNFNQKKVVIKKDKIVINEDDPIIQQELLVLINNYYGL